MHTNRHPLCSLDFHWKLLIWTMNQCLIWVCSMWSIDGLHQGVKLFDEWKNILKRIGQSYNNTCWLSDQDNFYLHILILYLKHQSHILLTHRQSHSWPSLIFKIWLVDPAVLSQQRPIRDDWQCWPAYCVGWSNYRGTDCQRLEILLRLLLPQPVYITNKHRQTTIYSAWYQSDVILLLLGEYDYQQVVFSSIFIGTQAFCAEKKKLSHQKSRHYVTHRWDAMCPLQVCVAKWKPKQSAVSTDPVSLV